jgi:hypothetical protein
MEVHTFLILPENGPIISGVFNAISYCVDLCRKYPGKIGGKRKRVYRLVKIYKPILLFFMVTPDEATVGGLIH